MNKKIINIQLTQFFAIFALIAVMGFTFLACDDGGSSSESSSTALSGTYTYDADYYYVTFNSNNTFTGVYDGYSISGTYSISGNKVTLTIPGYGTEILIIVNSNTLRDSYGDDWIKGSNSGKDPGTNPNPGGDTSVTLNSVSANGSSSQTTTQLTLTFNQAISGLSASDITLSGVSGVNKGSLSGFGPSYTLSISGFTSGGTLNVSVSKSGYNISGSSKSVTIYYSSGNSGGGTAPSAPTGVTATAQSSSSISISWSSVSGATGYYIYRSSSASGTYSQVGTSTTTSYSNTGLSASTTYYYKVAAYNSNGTSSQSSYDYATTSSSGSGGGGVTKPSAPTGVSATAQSSFSILVSWNAVSTATGYRVYRSSSSSGTYSIFAGGASPLSATSWTDTSCQPNTAYYYKVVAVNDGGDSNQSSTASATTPQALPNTPYGSPVIKSPTTSSLTIEWNAAARADTYVLERATSSSGPWTSVYNGSNTTYTNTGLSSGTTYYYRVKARNSAGDSGYTDVASRATN